MMKRLRRMGTEIRKVDVKDHTMFSFQENASWKLCTPVLSYAQNMIRPNYNTPILSPAPQKYTVKLPNLKFGTWSGTPQKLCNSAHIQLSGIFLQRKKNLFFQAKITNNKDRVGKLGKTWVGERGLKTLIKMLSLGHNKENKNYYLIAIFLTVIGGGGGGQIA